MAKAREELQHASVLDGMRRSLDYRRNKQARDLELPHLFYSCGVILSVLGLFACAFFPAPLLGHFECLRPFYLWLFGSRKAMQIFFVVVCFLHIGEAVLAWFLAQKVDSANAAGWFWQTLALGYGSLLLILRRYLAKGSSNE